MKNVHRDLIKRSTRNPTKKDFFKENICRKRD